MSVESRPGREATILTITSLLTILLLTVHLAGDIGLGFEKGGLANLVPMPIAVTWLYGALMLSDRRSGNVITLISSLLTLGVPILHMMGRGLGAGRTVGAFFFIWTVLALGVIAFLAVILSIRGLWIMRKDGVSNP
jgi:hypothetical protein